MDTSTSPHSAQQSLSSPVSTPVWIGLGSNLDQPQKQVERAFEALARLPDSRLLKTSSLWLSAPLGPQDQPDFINAVAWMETALEPLALLDALQAIEQEHQRQRLKHWGPRTLDLDLLLYGDLQWAHPRLQVPHPEMHRRTFVLKPLLELAPDLRLPQHGSAQACLVALIDGGFESPCQLVLDSLDS